MCSLSREGEATEFHDSTAGQLGALFKVYPANQGIRQLAVGNNSEASGKRFVRFSLLLVVEINVGHVQEVGVSM